MPSVFSIENINLNGGVLTTDNGFLYLNGNRVYFESGLPTKDNLFIKGYSPLTFYSRIAMHGTYLNEIYLNEEFIATGWLITCSQPGTGTQSLLGRFYSRNPSSVIDTQTIDIFNLENTKIFKYSNPFFNKVFANKVIGLDIFSVPSEMESISINLLGYFAGAGHFDRVPKVINYYSNEQLKTGFNIYEEFVQYDTTYTGIGIFANQSGVGPSIINRQNITGYISGTLDQYPIYSQILENNNGSSGYFVSGQKYIFPTGLNFSGFSGQSGFDDYWGYEYSGFEISRSGDNIFSGYFSTGKFGVGEVLEKIGTRNYTIQEKIIGFRSGYMDENLIFSGFTGTFGLQQKIIGFLSGYLDEFGNFTGLHILDSTSGSSGYYLNNLAYYFATGENFSGFSGQSNFDSIVGFEYSGFNFAEGSGFSGKDFIDSGYGIMTGFIGSRNITNSGYIISGIPYYFPTGVFSGFSGRYGFDNYLGHVYTGFTFPEGVVFSGLEYANSGTGILSGFIGHRNILTGESVSGFVTVFSDYDFKILTGSNFISGYFLDELKTGFNTGNFSGFDGRSGFFPEWGYNYSGFFINQQSGFSGLNYANSGTGIMTGLIGDRNVPYLQPMSGSFYYKDFTGFKNILQNFSFSSGINLFLNTGIYIKAPNNNRIGLDIYHTLSGLSEINISLMGFYD